MYGPQRRVDGISQSNQNNEAKPSLMLTILVVEDDPQFRQLLVDLLTYAGYKVKTAADGLEGLRVLHQMIDVPDLIVADIIMGKMDGCAFFEAVRTGSAQSWQMIPFVLMSTSSVYEAACPHSKLRPNAYMAKPFSYDEFVLTVQKILEKA
jgi:CheY-like chemotaxis protein